MFNVIYPPIQSAGGGGGGETESLVVADIDARDAIAEPAQGLIVFVQDATDDTSVREGWAEYKRVGGSWAKINEQDDQFELNEVHVGSGQRFEDMDSALTYISASGMTRGRIIVHSNLTEDFTLPPGFSLEGYGSGPNVLTGTITISGDSANYTTLKNLQLSPIEDEDILVVSGAVNLFIVNCIVGSLNPALTFGNGITHTGASGSVTIQDCDFVKYDAGTMMSVTGGASFSATRTNFNGLETNTLLVGELAVFSFYFCKFYGLINLSNDASYYAEYCYHSCDDVAIDNDGDFTSISNYCINVSGDEGVSAIIGTASFVGVDVTSTKAITTPASVNDYKIPLGATRVLDLSVSSGNVNANSSVDITIDLPYGVRSLGIIGITIEKTAGDSNGFKLSYLNDESFTTGEVFIMGGEFDSISYSGTPVYGPLIKLPGASPIRLTAPYYNESADPSNYNKLFIRLYNADGSNNGTYSIHLKCIPM
jgi:hypothetical protein